MTNTYNISDEEAWDHFKSHVQECARLVGGKGRLQVMVGEDCYQAYKRHLGGLPPQSAIYDGFIHFELENVAAITIINHACMPDEQVAINVRGEGIYCGKYHVFDIYGNVIWHYVECDLDAQQQWLDEIKEECRYVPYAQEVLQGIVQALINYARMLENK